MPNSLKPLPRPLAYYVEAARSHIGPRRPKDRDDAELWDGLTAAAEALSRAPIAEGGGDLTPSVRSALEMFDDEISLVFDNGETERGERLRWAHSLILESLSRQGGDSEARHYAAALARAIPHLPTQRLRDEFAAELNIAAAPAPGGDRHG